MSFHRALDLAIIENVFGVQSRYFIQLSSQFYNVFEAEIRDKISEIQSFGHWLGLHYDFENVDPNASKSDIYANMAFKKNIIETFFLQKQLHVVS